MRRPRRVSRRLSWSDRFGPSADRAGHHRRPRAGGPTEDAPTIAPVTPPEKLRVELERLRDRGYTLRQAWLPAVNAALRSEQVQTAVFYRQVFNEQRPLWAVSYSRAPWPANRRPTVDVLDEDRSSPARPRGATPVLA
jgi:hypothetical protein